MHGCNAGKQGRVVRYQLRTVDHERRTKRRGTILPATLADALGILGEMFEPRVARYNVRCTRRASEGNGGCAAAIDLIRPQVSYGVMPQPGVDVL